jgi:hypothetical protein
LLSHNITRTVWEVFISKVILKGSTTFISVDWGVYI